ncbi:unnamed protein product [Nippostrongylus brasiliensis]|uniref:Phlebovirus_G2 domain-containing protein n=1 Tax=Nippostrongylus brasiliensis TaxID=27835 RepID=A0A0N4YZH9_NIPBR|nr:unnamed protein product [Nippostrongylus brasiliensis]
MGICTGPKCAKITPQTLVEGLDIANNYTGITYRSESCGGFGCSCGYPSSGCLFYRIYHVPVDDDIYEVYHCPSWQQTVKLRLELAHNLFNIKTYINELQPYVTTRVDNVSLRITSLLFLKPSLLNKRFITNHNTTRYLNDEEQFSYACTKNPL